MERSNDVEPSPRRTAFSRYVLVIVLFVLLLIANLAFGMFVNGNFGSEWTVEVDEMVACLGVSMLFSEWGLHAIWTVFGRWRIVWRGLASAGMASLMLAFFLAPEFLDPYNDVMVLGSNVSEQWRESLKALLCLPLVVLGLQLPLWVLRWGWGWQVCSMNNDPMPEKSGQLSIGGILLATAVVGAAIACVRLAAAVIDVPVLMLMIPTAITSGVAAGMGLTMLVPAVFATLYARRLRLALSLQLVFLWSVLLGWLTLLCILDGAWPGKDDVAPLVIGFVAMPVMLHAPLLWGRSRGYRLVRVKKSLTP